MITTGGFYERPLRYPHHIFLLKVIFFFTIAKAFKSSSLYMIFS